MPTPSVRPSMIYDRFIPNAKKVIPQWLKDEGWGVIAFRPPKMGESFLMASTILMVAEECEQYFSDEEWDYRLIVEQLP